MAPPPPLSPRPRTFPAHRRSLLCLRTGPPRLPQQRPFSPLGPLFMAQPRGPSTLPQQARLARLPPARRPYCPLPRLCIPPVPARQLLLRHCPMSPSYRRAWMLTDLQGMSPRILVSPQEMQRSTCRPLRHCRQPQDPSTCLKLLRFLPTCPNLPLSTCPSQSISPPLPMPLHPLLSPCPLPTHPPP